MVIGSNPHRCKSAKLARGERIGKVERLMIDKLTGRIAYAILSFGGFLGIGADHYPIPWSMLTYNEKPDSFRLDR
jgi:hypothetical protein